MSDIARSRLSSRTNRSTKPLKMATIHYGPFDTGVGKADETEIRIYGVRQNIDVRKNMEFLKTEPTAKIWFMKGKQ